MGEREFARLLTDRGVEARRGQQFAGGPDSPDVVHSLAGVHFEVKRVEQLRLWPALEQAENDAPEGSVPVVAFRSNRRPWVVILRAWQFVDMRLELERLRAVYAAYLESGHEEDHAHLCPSFDSHIGPTDERCECGLREFSLAVSAAEVTP